MSEDYAPTVSALSAFVQRSRAVEERLAERFSELAASYAVHDSQLAALKLLCEALLLEADEEGAPCQMTEEVLPPAPTEGEREPGAARGAHAAPPPTPPTRARTRTEHGDGPRTAAAHAP